MSSDFSKFLRKIFRGTFKSRENFIINAFTAFRMFGSESFGVMGKSAETAADTVYANNFPASEKIITEKIFLKF